MVMSIVRMAAVLVCLAAVTVAAGERPLPRAPTAFVRRSSDEVGPGVAVVLAAEDRGIKGDVLAFNAAMKVEKPKYPANVALCLLAAGPRLDSPDQVTIGTLAREGNALTLLITYTSARVRGTQLRRNIQSTPVACELIPHDLAAGAYTLTVTWRCSDQPAEGMKKPADLVQVTKFELTN